MKKKYKVRKKCPPRDSVLYDRLLDLTWSAFFGAASDSRRRARCLEHPAGACEEVWSACHDKKKGAAVHSYFFRKVKRFPLLVLN